MSLADYGGLQAAVANWLARPGDSNISANVVDIITLFEAEARRRLKTRFNEATTTLTTTPGSETVALPSDFGEARQFLIASTDPIAPLVFMTPDELDLAYPSSTTDQPVNYTIEGLNLHLRPVPDQAYSITLDYLQGLVALSNASTSNWLLANHPDAYLFGSLAEAEAFIGVAQDASLWLQRREDAIESILTADRKARWGGGPLQIKTDTGNP